MGSVFLSYDRDDANAARVIATALEKAGHSVWWDLHVRGGAQFAKVIEEALKAADAVVVLWSRNSVDSAWVRDEATAGRDSGRLVPATIDGTDAPLGFRQFQTIELLDWKRSAKSRGYKELEQAIGELAQSAAPGVADESTSGPATPPPKKRSNTRRFAVALLALVALASGLGFWRFTLRPSSIPTVVVEPGEQSSQAEALSRDLLFKLGNLRAAKTDAVRLTAADAGRADFVFQAAGNNVALLSGKDRSVLWSKDFDAPGGNQTALEQSMAYTAGQVLDCAVQTSTPSEQRLDEQTLKLFLNACALFAERYRSDSGSLVPMFSQVIASAPRFEPAWSKLLLAETQNARGQAMFYGRSELGGLPEHIRQARSLNPRMPEVFVAETALLPIDAFEPRLRLFNQAESLNPENPDLRIVRAELYQSVGRNSDAVDDARHAVELNPLSPGYQSSFVQSLAYADQLPAALAQLRRAEQLWPGSPTIEDAQFRLESRYGDAKDALAMVRSPDFHQYYPTQEMEPYLLARIDPTSENVQRALAAVQNAQLAENRKLVQIALLLAGFGRNDELYKMAMAMPERKLRFVSQVFYRPEFRQFRHDQRFMQLERRAGLIDFWRKTGLWPDFCFEPDLPYDCKKEAAKVGV